VFRIRIGLNTDPDPDFEVNTDPVPGIFMTWHFNKTFVLLFTGFITNCFLDILQGSQALIKSWSPS
jgi:hypothetical protein